MTQPVDEDPTYHDDKDADDPLAALDDPSRIPPDEGDAGMAN